MCLKCKSHKIFLKKGHKHTSRSKALCLGQLMSVPMDTEQILQQTYSITVSHSKQAVVIVISSIHSRVRGEESSDSTGPIFISRRRGAARRRFRRHAGLPTTSSTRGTASWIQILDYRPTSDEDGPVSHNAPLWARPDATANPRR